MRTYLKFALTLAGLLLVSGCAPKVYWETEWHYVDTKDDISRTQLVTIESEPRGAYLFLGDSEHAVGTAPLLYTFPYQIVRTSLLRNQFKGKVPIAHETRDIETPVRTPYTLIAKLEGFRDQQVTLLVPLKEPRLLIRLRETGVISDIASTLLIEARTEYFSAIDSIVARYAGANGVLDFDEKAEVTPLTPSISELRQNEIAELNAQGIRVFEYSINVADSERFGDLVSDLRSLATAEHFVFEIYDARYDAKFTTNVLETGITHVLSGRRRSGARLFLIQNGAPDVIPESAFVGDVFHVQVTLRPEERYAYLISAFRKGRAVLLVYKELDVFSETERELSTVEEFQTLTGVADDQIDAVRASVE